MRRPEAWAGVYSDGSFALANDKKHLKGGHWKVVRLVEHSTAKERVIKAAVLAFERLQRPKHPHTRAETAIAILAGPIASYERSLKRGKKK